MIDWHCHLLPGIDDGPATMDEAVEMARALRQAGYATVYCTPHLVKGSFEADNVTVRTTLAALQAELARQRIELLLLPGREYYLDEFLLEYLKEPLPLGNERFILIEIPNHIPTEFVKETFYRIKCSGYVPMVAHPERCAHFAKPGKQKEGRFKTLSSMFRAFNATSDARHSKCEEASLLAYLKDIGCVFQGNLGSFAGMYGERVRQNGVYLKKMEIYSHYGTDMHSPVSGQDMLKFLKS